ncbi:MAG: EAL domain-containing protein [Pseudomonadota bacterium]
MRHRTFQSAIVDTIISLGRSLDLDVIAEGVEHAVQLDALARLGCRNFRGFYFSKPIEKSQLISLFASSQLERANGTLRSTNAA